MLTDAAKTNVWWARYEPFGRVHATGGTLTQNLGLPGQWFQLENGLAYNWHRHYDPTTGRYTTADPLGFVDGPSVFAYAGNAPHLAVDPSGLMGRRSDKERSTGIPSDFKGCFPMDDEKGRDFAARFILEVYGLESGTYPTGPGSDFSKIKKFGYRSM